MVGKLSKKDDIFYLFVDASWSIASTDVKDNRDNKLSLKNCEEVERGYDLDGLAEDWCMKPENNWSNNNNEFGDNYGSYKEGFQKALSILADKKFSEEQLRTAYNVGYTDGKDGATFYNRFIQSLQQTEWDCIVEMEKVKDETKIIGSVKGVKGSGHKITTYKSVPVFDENGCLILKRK